MIAQPVDIVPVAARKYTRYEIAELVEENYKIDLSDAAIARVLQVANKTKFTTPTDQLTAIGRAVDEEIAALPAPPEAVHRLRALAPEENLTIDTAGDERHPWFEEGRPVWSDPLGDRLDRMDGTTSRASSFWSSEMFAIPCKRYVGKIEHGVHKLANLRAAVVQSLGATEPYIALDRIGWHSTTGEPIQPLHHKFDLDEAVTLAHLLLNLVDLANEGQAPQSD